MSSADKKNVVRFPPPHEATPEPIPEPAPAPQSAAPPKIPFWRTNTFWAAITAVVTLAILLSGLNLDRAKKQEEINRLLQAASENMGEVGRIRVSNQDGLPPNILSRLAAAKTALDDALSKDSNNSRAISLLGVYHLKMGQLDEAQAMLEQAIQIDPGSSSAHCALGAVQFMREDRNVEDAIKSFEMAASLDPKNPLPLLNLGIAYRQAKNLDQAIAEFQKASKLEPRNYEIHFEIANTFQLEGKLPEAIDEYRQALALSPEDAEGLYNLGYALYATKDPVNAAIELQKAVRLAPKLERAQALLGQILSDQSDLERATGVLQSCVQSLPEFSDCHEVLGIVMMRQGNRQAAILEWKKALRQEPKDIDLWCKLVRALEGSQDTSTPCQV